MRSAAVVRDLLGHGWRAWVVSPRESFYHTPGRDLSVPPEVEVVRTGNLDLRRPFGLARRLGMPDEAVARLARALLVPDPGWGWVPYAMPAANRLLGTGDFDALVTAGAPWTAHLMGLTLSRRHHLPWIAMFADEWSTSTETSPATPFHRRLNRRWEGRVLSEASAVTMPTDLVRERILAAHPGLRPEVVMVRNGYVEEDFRGLVRTPADRFTLTYAGSLYPATSPESVLPALRILLDRRPGLSARVRLRILGACHTPFAARARSLGLSDVVSMEGPRGHAEAVQAMMDAHALLDARAESPSAAAQRSVKLLEYLRAGPPVLGFYPDGEAASLMARFPDCVRLAPGDSEGASRALESWIVRWEEGRWSEPVLRPGIEPLERGVENARLAEALDRLRPMRP